MAEDTNPMDVTRAEGELLELVRGVAERDFSLNVSCLRGVWTVKRADVKASASVEYQSATFDAAWAGARPRAKGRPNLRVIEGEG